ncbi:hypothetical protein FRX31_029790 [Thalictrum thalictroides]|uniref:Uncharacterized protein n=1 Tax=Thalictrum thalictroides TaxID=46969 RepID=A0A7J6V687_THATH|nr:hypothetical protein FRX31_029790 [Thalictrum thalictroides]
MADTIWIEGPNYQGFGQDITYPSFLYCSSCAKIEHAWENCRHRLQKQQHKSDNVLNNQKNKQPLKVVQPQEPAWRQQKRKAFYTPTGRIIENGEARGAKDDEEEVENLPATEAVKHEQHISTAELIVTKEVITKSNVEESHDPELIQDSSPLVIQASDKSPSISTESHKPTEAIPNDHQEEEDLIPILPGCHLEQSPAIIPALAYLSPLNNDALAVSLHTNNMDSDSEEKDPEDYGDKTIISYCSD